MAVVMKPYTLRLEIDGRVFELQGDTQMIGAGLANDTDAHATAANTLLFCSKSYAEAAVWASWQRQADQVNTMRIPKEKM